MKKLIPLLILAFLPASLLANENIETVKVSSERQNSVSVIALSPNQAQQLSLVREQYRLERRQLRNEHEQTVEMILTSEEK